MPLRALRPFFGTGVARSSHLKFNAMSASCCSHGLAPPSARTASGRSCYGSREGNKATITSSATVSLFLAVLAVSISPYHREDRRRPFAQARVLKTVTGLEISEDARQRCNTI